MCEHRTPGQAAYEKELSAKPNFDDGAKRPQWNELPDVYKSTWEKNPTPRWIKNIEWE